MLCDGQCGREAVGHYDSGGRRPAAADRQYVWCKSCMRDLDAKRMPPGLARYVTPLAPVPPSHPARLSSVAGAEAKITVGEHKTAVALEAPAGLVTPSGADGSFEGYFAATGNRDHGGDTLLPGSMYESAAALNAGHIRWLLTDSHSEKATDIVAEITHAVPDSRGLRVSGNWMPTAAAQQLRDMVKAGHRLGLSITYLPDRARPDGAGGRLLEKVTIVGGAITPTPMNPRAMITSGKGAGAAAPIVGWLDGPAADRDQKAGARAAEAERLADEVLGLPPGLSLSRETKAAALADYQRRRATTRMQAEDCEAQRAARRRAQLDDYYFGLRETMATCKPLR
jgi:HK97 family phage prohead protease